MVTGRPGACKHTSVGASFDCTRSNKGAWRLGARENLTTLDRCVELCHRCARCAHVAFSRKERQCSWSASCRNPSSSGRLASYEHLQVSEVARPALSVSSRHFCSAHPSSKVDLEAPTVLQPAAAQLQSGCTSSQVTPGVTRSWW